MDLLAREYKVLSEGLSEGAQRLCQTTWADAQKAAMALTEKPVETSLAYLNDHKIDILAGAGIAMICGRSQLMHKAMLAWSFNGLAVSGLTAVRDAADESIDLQSVKKDFAKAVSHEASSFVSTLPAAYLGGKLAHIGKNTIKQLPLKEMTESLTLPQGQMALAGGGTLSMKPGFFAMQAENNSSEIKALTGKAAEVRTSAHATPETVENPYLEEYKTAMRPFVEARGKGRDWMQTMDLELAAKRRQGQLIPKYGFAVHDSESLAAIVKAADGKPIVELGAGNGYLAHLLRQMGVKVTAYDKFVPESGANEWFSSKPWTEVQSGDVNSLVKHRDEVLLLSWPDYASSMASDALKAFPGNKVIYIGEGIGGCTGDKKFHEMLSKDWQSVDSVPMLDWPGTRTMLGVCTRKSRQINNPCLEEYNKAKKIYDEASPENKHEARMNFYRVRTEAQTKFGYANLDEAALGEIGKFVDGDPIVEMGAGSGYVSYLLRQQGHKVKAFDLQPVESGLRDPQYTSVSKSWTGVARGTPENLKRYSDHVLMMSWPPGGGHMADDALLKFRGDKFIYLGEKEGGCTGTDNFFKILERNWQLEKEVAIPRWPGLDDQLWFYTRKKPN